MTAQDIVCFYLFSNPCWSPCDGLSSNLLLIIAHGGQVNSIPGFIGTLVPEDVWCTMSCINNIVLVNKCYAITLPSLIKCNAICVTIQLVPEVWYNITMQSLLWFVYTEYTFGPIFGCNTYTANRHFINATTFSQKFFCQCMKWVGNGNGNNAPKQGRQCTWEMEIKQKRTIDGVNLPPKSWGGEDIKEKGREEDGLLSDTPIHGRIPRRN